MKPERRIDERGRERGEREREEGQAEPTEECWASPCLVPRGRDMDALSGAVCALVLAAWAGGYATGGREAAALAGNAAWFGAGFCFFSFGPITRQLVTRRLRGHPLVLSLREAVRFLGGLNLALAALSAAVLVARVSGTEPHLFEHAAERAILFAAFAVGHATQFAFNVPRCFAGRTPEGALWDIKGTMLFIFVMDLAQALINAFCASAPI